MAAPVAMLSKAPSKAASRLSSPLSANPTPAKAPCAAISAPPLATEEIVGALAATEAPASTTLAISVGNPVKLLETGKALESPLPAKPIPRASDPVNDTGAVKRPPTIFKPIAAPLLFAS